MLTVLFSTSSTKLDAPNSMHDVSLLVYILRGEGEVDGQQSIAWNGHAPDVVVGPSSRGH